MNMFKEFDHILASCHCSKAHSLIASTVSKELFLITEKLKKRTSSIKPEDLKILSAYLRENLPKTQNSAECCLCHSVFPVSVMEHINGYFHETRKNGYYTKNHLNADSSDHLVCPICVLSKSDSLHYPDFFIRCAECHKISFGNGKKMMPVISFNRWEYEEDGDEEDADTDAGSYLAEKVAKECPDFNEEAFKYHAILDFNQDKGALEDFYKNPSVLCRLTDGLITEASAHKIAKYSPHDELCLPCFCKIFNINLEQASGRDKEIISSNKITIETSSEKSWLDDTTDEIAEKAKKNLIELLENIYSGDIDAVKVKKFNFLGFPKPPQAILKRTSSFGGKSWLEAKVLELYKEITDDNGYYKNINQLMEKSGNIIEMLSANDYVNILIILGETLLVKDEGEIEEIINSSFNMPIKCPWSYSNEWYYYSIKNRDPSQDRKLLESGKIPYCKCNVIGRVDNLSIDQNEDSSSISFDLFLDVTNKEVFP